MDAVTFQTEAMRYERLLYHISYTMLRSDAVCADAVQEALLRAWQRRDTLQKRSAFRAWLCRILVNTCNDMLRRKNRVKEVELTEELPAQAESDAALQVREALDSLPPDQRAAVMLHYLEGWSVKEIASMLDVPPSTVKSRLMYARKRLYTLLSDEMDGEGGI